MRKSSVQKSLRSISKCIKAHAEAHDDFCKATDAMQLMLGEHAKALASAAEGDKGLQGYLGYLGKMTKAHAVNHATGKAAVSNFHDGINKVVSGAASAAGVDLSIGNANSTDATYDTEHNGHNTTEPGEIEHGLKGATAGALQKASDALARPTLFSKVQSLVNVRPNANLAKSNEGGWRPMPEPAHYNGHPSTLSTYEQRKRDGSR